MLDELHLSDPFPGEPFHEAFHKVVGGGPTRVTELIGDLRPRTTCCPQLNGTEALESDISVSSAGISVGGHRGLLSARQLEPILPRFLSWRAQTTIRMMAGRRRRALWLARASAPLASRRAIYHDAMPRTSTRS